MFQRLQELWYHPDRRRIQRISLILVMALVCVCTVQRGLTTKAARVEAAEPDGTGEADTESTVWKQAKKEAAAMLEIKKRLAAKNGNAEQETQETGAGQVQGLTEEAAHIKEIEAIEASIVPGQYPIMGESSIKVEQMVSFFESKGESYPSEELSAGGAPDIETFCQIYYDEAVSEGVRPEVAFVQTMKETGWLQYGGDASISQFNFAGLGTTGGGVPGNSYPDVKTGVRAQIQHLKAYATDLDLSQDCVDDRYQYVTKGCAPFVEWLGQNENPEGYGWATGLNYGYDIVDMIHTMRGL